MSGAWEFQLRRAPGIQPGYTIVTIAANLLAAIRAERYKVRTNTLHPPLHR